MADPHSPHRFGEAPAEIYVHTARKPAGGTRWDLDPTSPYFTGRDRTDLEEHDTLMCVHCQMHWQIIVGSGREHAFCFNCNGPTCSKRKCLERCEPWELAIERAEGRNRTTSVFKGAHIL